MNYTLAEKTMLFTRRMINSFIFTKKINGKLERPIVSFTFDDVPKCTFDYAVPILNKFGCKGTFYVSGMLCQKENSQYLGRSEILNLYKDGHEIGCHTFSHIKAGFVSPEVFANDIEKNKQYFSKDFSIVLENFSYPNGSVGIWNKPLVNHRFCSARTTCKGINNTPVDSAFLLAYKLYSNKLDLNDVSRLLAQTKKTNGWLIFYTHDVCPKPSKGGCEPEFLENAIRQAYETGAEILNIRDALKCLKLFAR